MQKRRIIMTQDDFHHIIEILDGLSAEQMWKLRHELDTRLASTAKTAAGPPAGSLGSMRDDADLLDQAVAHAMKVREERPWRLPPDE